MGISFRWDDLVLIQHLTSRSDLNGRAGRVCKLQPRFDGRVGVELMIGSERLWVKPRNLLLIENEDALENEPFKSRMSNDEIVDCKLFFCANKNSVVFPGIGGRLMTIN